MGVVSDKMVSSRLLIFFIFTFSMMTITLWTLMGTYEWQVFASDSSAVHGSFFPRGVCVITKRDVLYDVKGLGMYAREGSAKI